jgi:hypothetical protein
VNVTYELQNPALALTNVIVSLPLGPGAGKPVVTACDGLHVHNAKERTLEWSVDRIDAAHRSGALEFTVPGTHTDAFFPVTAAFTSDTLLCDLGVTDVLLDGDVPKKVRFASTTALSVESFVVE